MGSLNVNYKQFLKFSKLKPIFFTIWYICLENNTQALKGSNYSVKLKDLISISVGYTFLDIANH